MVKNETLRKLNQIQIDYKAVELYFKLLKDAYDDVGEHMDSVRLMCEMIIQQHKEFEEYDKSGSS